MRNIKRVSFFLSGEFPLSLEEISIHVEKLLTLNSASPWGNLAQGIIYQQNNHYAKAKAHLRVGMP